MFRLLPKSQWKVEARAESDRELPMESTTTGLFTRAVRNFCLEKCLLSAFAPQSSTTKNSRHIYEEV